MKPAVQGSAICIVWAEMSSQNDASAAIVRVALPFHLRTLARVTGPEVQLDIAPPVTQQAVIDALEQTYPALQGTIRDPLTGRRRPLIRFFACQTDYSDAQPTDPLPAEVASGAEPLLVIGAIAGG